MLTLDTPNSIEGKPPSAAGTTPNAVDVVPPKPPQTTSSEATAIVGNGPGNDEYRHIWLVTGPAGSGKSTVAAFIAQTLNFPYIEGDEFHPPANIQKMSSGIPLTDEDRWDWLTALREESIRQVQAGPVGVVLTCSALKQKYRDVIRVAGYRNRSLRIHFLYLSVTEELLLSRVRARQNHYMSADMVHSQVRILEPPTCAEPDVISIDASGSLEEVQRVALAKVLETMSYE